MVRWEVNVALTQTEFINSMKEEIFQLPFTNCLGENVFPTNTKIDGSSLVVEMSDGTAFKIQATKM
jgi:hypothetical protein